MSQTPASIFPPEIASTQGGQGGQGGSLSRGNSESILGGIPRGATLQRPQTAGDAGRGALSSHSNTSSGSGGDSMVMMKAHDDSLGSSIPHAKKRIAAHRAMLAQSMSRLEFLNTMK